MTNTESLTSIETTETDPKVAAVEKQLEQEEAAIDRLVAIAKLRRYLYHLGFKPGKCDYCGAEGEEGKVETEVFVRKLPNKLRACYLCFKRGE